MTLARWSVLAIAILINLIASAPEANAFPEMVRHGYANCVSCHVNLGGGGVLNEYGRALSLEALSTWGTEKEAQTAYGLFTSPEWLNAAIETRALGYALEQPDTLTLSTVLMQADAEAAVTLGGFSVVGTAGYFETEGAFISRRHYAQYRLSDTVAVRAGKFYPVYGLMIAEHTSFIRRNNGFDQAQESYNLEASYVGENWSGFITGILESNERSLYNEEKGVALSGSYFFSNRFKLGLSAQRTSVNGNTPRVLLGAHAALGFTSRFFYLGELDWVDQNSKEGWTSYQRVDLEPIQGLHFFVTDEWVDSNRKVAGATHRFGPGIQFFPRPHIELQFQAQWQSTSNIPDSNLGIYSAMLNYYL